MSLLIRRARPDEAGIVLSLVRELAEYEKLLHEVEATEEVIGAALFGDNPRLFCDIAEWNGEAAGFAVWFLNFSTFRGRHGLYVEDLFVRPENLQVVPDGAAAVAHGVVAAQVYQGGHVDLHVDTPDAASGRLLLRLPGHAAMGRWRLGTRVAVALAADEAVAFSLS